MARRVLLTLIMVFSLCSLSGGIAQAQPVETYVEHLRVLAPYQEGDPSHPSNPDGFSSVCYEFPSYPTGEYFNVVAPEGWTVEFKYLEQASNYISWNVIYEAPDHDGYDWIELDFVCARGTV